MRSRSDREAVTTRQAAPRNGLPLQDYAFDVATSDGGGLVTMRQARAQQFIERLAHGVDLEMVRIPGGVFTMGAPETEAGSNGGERPQHQVTVRLFYLGKYTVTIEQWRAVMGTPPQRMEAIAASFGASPKQPAVRVSYNEVEAFCARLSEMTGRSYRLPSEAEWEYACRAGTMTPFAFGETITPTIANYSASGRATTVAAASLRVANDFGLFDMHGNVWEWCRDLWHGDYRGAPADGSAWLSDSDIRTRVLRGGAWSHPAKNCRSAVRSLTGDVTARSSKIGFRVAMTE
jgi:formylglycine-generating enzyme required for sulfatase activity